MFRLSPICLLPALLFATTIAHAQDQSTRLFRSLGLLGPNASLTKVTARQPLNSQNRVAPGALTTGRQNLTGPLKFDFSGYPAAQRAVLQQFVNENYARMVSVYGAPAPEQAGKTVKVVFEASAADYEPPAATNDTGGTIFFGYDDTRNAAVNTYNFTRVALIAFQGPRVPAFDFAKGSYVEPWLYGAADAGAFLVAFQAQGSPANFNPSSLGGYLLPLYDYFNRPGLGNAYIYPRSGSPLAISAFRLTLAQAAFLKLTVEKPDFLAQFNARLYARGAARTPVSSADLQSLAASVTPNVEGRSFNDWVRAQYALDASVTTGQKLYVASYPFPTATSGASSSKFAVFAQAFETDDKGSETASTGFGSIAAFDETGRDISSLSSLLRSNNVLNFGSNANFPGEANFQADFDSLGNPNRALVTIKARYKQAEATAYTPVGVAGDTGSTSSYFGGTLGGQNGTLQLSGSATQNVSVTRGTWAASAPYPSGPRVQTAFTFGGVTVRRNTAWLNPGAAARSVAFLLDVPANQQALNFSTPAGKSSVRMVSLPGFPIKTDEAAALNLAPNALKLARYRPDLSPAIARDGALQFGIGGDRYELYPNISTPLSPGRGYWLGVGESGYSTPVQASLPPANRAYEVPLQGGWNQIGVPFNRAFAPSAIQVRNGGFAPVSLAVAQTRGWVAPGIWRWLPAGGYVRADVGTSALAPFEGYFIFVGPTRGVSLIFNPSATAVAKASSARTEAGSWSVNLDAVGEETQDIAGVFGVSSAPNIAKPPAGARVVSLRFEGGDAQGAAAAGSGLAEAYVSALGEGASWTAIIDGAETGENVTLKWGKFEGAARNVALSLLDTATGARVAMKSGGQYRFVAGAQPRRIVIAAVAARLDPKLAPSLAPAAAKTADVLAVTPNASGFADEAKLTYAYVWRNGRRVLNENGATLDLRKPGNGDRGDTISVEVTARDEAGHTATGTASVKVGNSNPFVADGNLRVQTGVTGSVALSSSDADGDELQLARSNSPARGVADVRKVNGVWTLFYTGFKGQTGADAVEIVAFDGFHGRSKTAQIKIAIWPGEVSNRAPVAYDGAVDSARGETATETLLASDPDGDATTFRLVRGTTFGSSTIALDAADGKWKLRATNTSAPTNNIDSAQFVAIDSAGRESNVATITIRFHNRAPIASDVSANVASGVEIAVPVAGFDADGEALTYKRVGGPRNGTGELRRDSDGIWKMFYRSRAGWTGVENVRYVALDEQGRPSAPATIEITVTASGAAASGASTIAAPSVSAGAS